MDITEKISEEMYCYSLDTFITVLKAAKENGKSIDDIINVIERYKTEELSKKVNK